MKTYASRPVILGDWPVETFNRKSRGNLRSELEQSDT